jgi:hypothetical protein
MSLPLSLSCQHLGDYDYDGPQACAEREHGKTHQAGFRDVRSNDNFGITGIRTPPVDMVFGSADHLAMGLRAADRLPQCRISTTGILSPITGINPGGRLRVFSASCSMVAARSWTPPALRLVHWKD